MFCSLHLANHLIHHVNYNTQFVSSIINALGSIEEHEYFGEVLIGIKHVIQNHLRDVQVKFQDRVIMLEAEIKHRDVVITQLQHRIIELEQNSLSPLSESQRLGGGGNSTGSSGEIPFVVRPRSFAIIVNQ